MPLQVRTAVRLKWLSISFSKVHNYLATLLMEETGEEYF